MGFNWLSWLWRRVRDSWRTATHRAWVDYPLPQFEHGRTCGVSLTKYVRRFTRPDAHPRSWLFGSVLTRGTGYVSLYDNAWHIFRDGNYGFVLTVGIRPAALITWDVVGVNDDTILVRQIQGVRHTGADLLRSVRWEKMLLQMAVDWAAANGYREIRLARAEACRWYHSCPSKEAMRMKYEVTGKRLGFRPVPERDYLARTLEPTV